MSLGPILQTPRLILRPPAQEDFDAWASMYAETDTMKFIGGAQPRDAAWRYLATMAGAWALQGYAMFSVIEKASGNWIGRLGPWRPGGEEGGWPGPEVGWALNAASQRKGYAAEGASAAIDWAFDHLGWTEMIHCIDAANTPSIALAERLGSRWLRKGKLPAPFGLEVEIYGQSKAAWRARKR